ncbi:hypothetical protein M422DRAFT_242531 [Sphaerobolus stellatus SS14]|nr:hypothetical protein M422DRAFT_242531 [Sphaerobolus stellatus SS14]
MSATNSSSKPTTATAILYKRSKDVPHLPLVELQDLMKGDNWVNFEKAEQETIIKGYWQAYDKEHDELEKHYLTLVRKEAKVENKWRSEEEEKKKKKSKPTAPIALGSGKSKGKGKAVEEEVINSEFEADTEF